MNAIKESEPKPIVAQVVDQPAIDSSTWELQPLNVQGGEASGVQGLVRLVGAAQAALHDQLAIVQPFLLDLGDEALQLMDHLQ